MQYVLDDRGRPITFLSDLAEHTKNIRRDGRASMLVASAVVPGDDPMSLPRVTLVGSFALIDDDDVVVMRERFLSAHPTAASYVEFRDFGW